MRLSQPATKNLVDTKQLSKIDMMALLERARYWEKHWRPGCTRFQGRFAANLFFEPSTRTRSSFEVAEKRLGMEVINFTPEVSSTSKGESLYDTVKTLASVGVEVAVIRHSDSGAFLKLTAQEPGCVIINAGAGCFAHPTQALLDLYTMMKQFGDLTDKKVAVVGDIKHSRVVRSNIWTLKQFGAEMMVSGPDSMRDEEVEKMAPYVPFEEALAKADVVMMLRVQLERHHQQLFSSAEKYHQQYGLTREKADSLKRGAIIMHPGPVNRGIEIADEVVEHPCSRIFDQMANGVWVRMAVIERALGGE